MSTVRPARKEDLAAAAVVLNEHSRRLYGVDDLTVPDLRQYWESPDVDFGSDVLVAENGAGELVGYADLGLHGDDVWVDVRATDDDALPGLLEGIEVRATAKKPGATLVSYAATEDESLLRVFELSGYEVVRHSFRMRIVLDDGLPAPSWPEGISVRPFRSGEEKRVYEAQMGSFADTWRFAREPFEVWKHWMIDDPAFDPTLWRVAEAERGDIAGILLARVADQEPGLGWVRILGVLPDHRRKGLGEALLLGSFREFSRRGFDSVGLGVDAQNPTGALRLYERAGMHVERKNLLLEKVQP